MTGLLRLLTSISKVCRDALLSPAQDPRKTDETEDPRQRETVPRPHPHLDDLRKSLERGFALMSLDAGATVLNELSHEFAQLAPVLERSKSTDPLSVAHIPAPARDRGSKHHRR